MALPDSASPVDMEARSKLKLGLFSYPVLQAADILVHRLVSLHASTFATLADSAQHDRATHVPVGEDQAQHLEFTRELVTNFNSQHGEVLVPPETIISPAKRIMSLKDPVYKMSKSDPNPRSRILINDSRETINHNIRQALTDSINSVTYDPKGRPGIANLLEILSHIEGGNQTLRSLADEHRDLGLGSFKTRVADAIDRHLAPIRERFEEISCDESSEDLKSIAVQGACAASRNAQKTLGQVRDVIGF
ncbi:Tryptophan--tRNA ligase, mitochondrial [Agyrium rufum]|nr:Tryptophan--tRNA ligase, mitochondrial [Agyrium rufum]